MTKPRNGILLGGIIATAHIFLAQIINNPKNTKPEKNGGYLIALDANDNSLLLVTRIGNVVQEKIKKYQEIAMEKAQRVIKNIQYDLITSWQSRFPEDNQFGGAILCKNNIVLSFSGLTEHGDEALVTYLALSRSWITKQQAYAISKISQNPLIQIK